MRVAVLTVSDSVSRGEREDRSGPAVVERCRAAGWQIVSAEAIADDRERLETQLIILADSGSVDLILTTGGTGIGPRDITPEATESVCKKNLPGLGELMRQKGRDKNPRSVLSRAVAGVRSRALIVNLPGSPRGALESLDAVADLLPHAVEVLRGASHD
ncbi:MAG TPA: MogA/MoaB family molybdenum cofactor biosynthesis protein [Candidatus Acidoferrales bacterium]|jgi:molybdenum cofactor synthesis domain-containing protein|nr:MogA/MoaB family molybdenum cofactor biosynthesis protein [Candidatus Acidoferrales bacterium]